MHPVLGIYLARSINDEQRRAAEARRQAEERATKRDR